MTDRMAVVERPVAILTVETKASSVATVQVVRGAILVAPAAQGPAGRDGGGTRFEHQQLQASSAWTVNHNLGYRPLVSVISLAGEEQIVSVRHVSNNLLMVLPDNPTTGFAICS